MIADHGVVAGKGDEYFSIAAVGTRLRKNENCKNRSLNVQQNQLIKSHKMIAFHVILISVFCSTKKAPTKQAKLKLDLQDFTHLVPRVC